MRMSHCHSFPCHRAHPLWWSHPVSRRHDGRRRNRIGYPAWWARRTLNRSGAKAGALRGWTPHTAGRNALPKYKTSRMMDMRRCLQPARYLPEALDCWKAGMPCTRGTALAGRHWSFRIDCILASAYVCLSGLKRRPALRAELALWWERNATPGTRLLCWRSDRTDLDRRRARD